MHGLPIVNVRLATKELGGEGGETKKGGEGEAETLEVELRSQWQTVTVSEGLSSSTVSLGARGEIGTRMELLEAGA